MTFSVYKLRYVEGFEWLLPTREDDIERLRFDGRSVEANWKPVEMTRLRTSERGQPLRRADFPACSGGDMLIMNRIARERLGRVLDEHGEILRLACPDGEYYALNVTRLVDALALESSQVLRASDTGAVLMIRKHVFRPEVIDAQIFKLPQTTRGLIYVTRPFVELVTSSGLEGLEFVPVWASN
jgi:hypothetical protein